MAETAGPEGAQGVIVLDTSAVLGGGWDREAGRCIAPPGVAAEFSPGGRSHSQWERLQAAGLRVQDPDPEALKRVEAVARRLGETRLSRADLEVAALTLQHEGTGTPTLAVTDDYALQNLMSELGLRFQGAREKGITKRRSYRLRCSGCGRWYPPEPPHAEGADCPVCGSALRRRRAPGGLGKRTPSG